jgi:uncharacterized protein (DUF1684 family)
MRGLLLALLTAVPGPAAAKDRAFRAEVEAFRDERERRLKDEDGWLTVSGLFFLREGENRFGSDSLNDIVLPPSAPAQCGSFVFKGGRAEVRLMPGVQGTIEREPVRTAELVADKTRLELGRLTLLAHKSGERFGIRLKDKDSALRTAFKGLDWFAPREAWRVKARYVKYAKPKTLEIPNMLGDPVSTTLPGYVEFKLADKTQHWLDAEQAEDGTLSFIFKDLTSGKETYGAGRFLEAPAPDKHGNLLLDFNKAYNPPCAYNPHTTCPLPPPGNSLETRVEAGEKAYKAPKAASK